MLKRGTDTGSLVIELSMTGVRLLRTSGWLHAETQLIAEQPIADSAFAAPELLARQLRDILGNVQFSGMNTSIILPDAAARLFMVSPPRNSSSLRDCQAAAGMRFHELYGETFDGWKLEADWNALQPFLACALQIPLLNDLQQISTEHRLSLMSVAPQFIAAWNRWHSALNPRAWFGVIQGNTMTLGVIDRKRLNAVRTVPIPENAWQDDRWLPALLEREAMRLSLPVPDKFQLCGSVATPWASRLMGALQCSRLDFAQSGMSNATNAG